MTSFFLSQIRSCWKFIGFRASCFISFSDSTFLHSTALLFIFILFILLWIFGLPEFTFDYTVFALSNGFNAKSTFEWAYVKLTLFLIVIRVCWRPSWFFLSHDFYILFRESNWNCISWSFASRESILSSSFLIAEDSWLRVDYSIIFCCIVYSRVVIILNRRIK